MGENFRKGIFAIAWLLGILSANGQSGPERKSLKKTKEIKELKKEAGKKTIKDEKVRDEKGAIWTNGFSPESVAPPMDSSTNFKDNRRQSQQNPAPNTPSGSILTSFNGIAYTGVVPPDPTLAVGPNHIIHLINGTSGSMFMVSNKSGTTLIPATFLDQVTGIGGFADPIALYDHLADRFVIIEMVNVNEVGAYGISMAVTKTPDPTGAWDVYFLNTGSNLPDYPKLSVWPDAYYITANEFTNATSYAGTFAYALDRNAILQGQASPQAVRIRLGLQSKHVSACPVTLQGQPNGTSANGLIAWMQDDVWSTWDAADTDSIGLFKFNVNWANPSLSTITNVVSLAAAPFKSNVCTASRGRCIPQPGTTLTLEALHQKVMNQPVYRSFPGFEGLVMAHTTDAANEQAGIRWYELRKTDISSSWIIGQQSTWSPDATHRFMPSISYNQRGDIALAYNVSDGASTMPGLRFTGRRNCDPNGTMTVPETNIMAGSSYSASARFGDYNHLVADPVNGNFWFAGEYMPNFQWAIRIAQFQIDSCVQVCDVPTNLFTKNITYSSATLSWAQASGINYYEVEYKAAADVNWISAGNTTSDSLNLANLTENTSYNWRIRSHCNFGNSLWVSGFFSTPQRVCLVPASATTSQITISSARLSWGRVSDAIDYNLQYQRSGDTGWIDLPVTAADTSYNLSGLLTSTAYNWRVNAVCTPTLQSAWSNQSFVTPAEVCDPPSGLQTTLITFNSARLSWVASPSNPATALEYQAAGDANWINIPIAPGTTQYNLGGLTPTTNYNWRVRTLCTTVQSNYVGLSFATPAEICNAPSGLQTTLITFNSANLSWVPSAGNSSVALEYQAAGDPNWVNIPIAPGTTQFNLTGLSPATSYNWRVRTLCVTVQSSWAGQTFATPAQPCNPPAALTTTDITAGSAQLNWGQVNGAGSYRVEFQRVGATSWTLLTAATTANTAFLSGLSASTSYNWRVSATCPQNTTAFSQASFVTTGTCGTPTNPVTSGLTSSGATLGWTSVKSVTGYRVEYKLASATSWTVMPNTTSTSLVLSGLQPQTTYQWRVRSLCTAGPSAPTAIQSFTTFGPPCPDPYEPNNTNKALAPIPVKTDIYAAISTGTDQDWFSFFNTTAEPNIRITLSQLPKNYSMTLYSPSGRSVVKAARTGLVDETITYNTTVVGKYWLQILPASSSEFDPSRCYKLYVGIQSGTNAPEPDLIYTSADISNMDGVKPENGPGKDKVKIFPNPASERIYIQVNQNNAKKTTATLTDQTGRILRERSLSGTAGEYFDISNLPAGVYYIKVKTGETVMVEKIMVRK